MKARKVPQGKRSPESQMSQEIPSSETALEAKFLRSFKRKNSLKTETCCRETESDTMKRSGQITALPGRDRTTISQDTAMKWNACS